MREDTRTVLWCALGQSVSENYSEGKQTVLELLNRFGADGWELASIQDHREGEAGFLLSDASRLFTVYTFKRPRVLLEEKNAQLIRSSEGSRSRRIRANQSAYTSSDKFVDSSSVAVASVIRFTVCWQDGDPAHGTANDSGFTPAAGRLLIVSEVARARSQGEVEFIERLRVDYLNDDASEGWREDIRAAASEYMASAVQDQLAIKWFEVSQSFPLSNAAKLLNGSAEWLRGQVENPLADISASAGFEGPEIDIGAGIIANFVAAPVTKRLGKAARVCEIIGIVVGVATGAHPLVMACTKLFVHDKAKEVLSEGFENIFKSMSSIADSISAGFARTENSRPGAERPGIPGYGPSRTLGRPGAHEDDSEGRLSWDRPPGAERPGIPGYGPSRTLGRPGAHEDDSEGRLSSDRPPGAERPGIPGYGPSRTLGRPGR